MKIKRIAAFLLGVITCFALTACGNETPQPEQSETPAETEVTLYADFSCGNENALELELIKTYPKTLSEVTPETLAEALTELTGLDFFISAVANGKTVTVDWAANSTLVGGLDEREQKEEFFFFDNYSLSWFMMDSLYMTVKENLGAEEVYYTVEGGKELAFEDLSPVNIFPLDVPYMGSPFYFAHSDVKGDEEDSYGWGENVFARTEGTWRLDGEEGTAYIEMDGTGSFWAYYADGMLEFAGYLEYFDEFEDGNGRYDMYDLSGEYIDSFYFHEETGFHMGGNYGDAVYMLDNE